MGWDGFVHYAFPFPATSSKILAQPKKTTLACLHLLPHLDLNALNPLKLWNPAKALFL